MTDYPDFQREPNRQTANLLPGIAMNLPTGDNPFDVIPVGSYDGIMVRCAPVNGYGLLTVTWYDDPLGNTPVASPSWNINGQWALNVFLPSQGPYVRADVNVGSAANMTGTLRLAARIGTAGQVYYPITNNRIVVGDHALAANTTEQFPLPFIMRGSGFVSFLPDDAAGQLEVWTAQLNADATRFARVATIGQPTAVANLETGVPDNAFALVVRNHDAAGPHSYQATLTVVQP